MIVPERQQELEAIFAKYIRRPETRAIGRAPSSSRPSLKLKDDEVIHRGETAANGEKFRRLFYDGDTSLHGGDDSAADLALCAILAYWCPDPEQVDRLFRRSALYRDKWDETRGASTYGGITLARAYESSVGQPAFGNPNTWTEHSLEVGDEAPTSPEGAAILDSLNTSIENRETHGFQLVALDALLSEPEEERAWVVDNLLPTGGTSLVVAKPKVGKSTLVRNLALSVARGAPFLDHDVHPGKVVYLALEEKRSEVKSHFHRMGGTAEGVLVYVGPAPQHPMDALSQLVESEHPVLVIIDPLLRFLRMRDANDYAEVNKALEPLNTLARNSGTHILYVHHAGKASERDNGDSVLGSTAFFGAVDTLIEIRKSDSSRVLYSTQRYGIDIPQTVVTFDIDSGLVSLGGSVKENQVQEYRQRVLAAVGDDDLDENQIKELVGGNQTHTSHAIRGSVAAGDLVREGHGRKGDPYRYHKPRRESSILDSHIEENRANDTHSSRRQDSTASNVLIQIEEGEREVVRI